MLFALTLAGMALAGLSILTSLRERRVPNSLIARRRFDSLLITLMSTFTLGIGIFWLIPLPWQRYLLPLVPFVCLWVAYAITTDPQPVLSTLPKSFPIAAEVSTLKNANSPILAINTHAALDRIFFIERFVPETNMRACKVVEAIGGKGLDVAAVLKSLEAPVQAISFIAGKNGEILADLLHQKQIPTDLLWLPGETRLANVIIETELHRHSHISTTGYRVDRGHCDRFLARLAEFAAQAAWAVISGSLPPGAPVDYYSEIIRLLHDHHVQALIDTVGPALLETLTELPEIVKMNRLECSETFGLQAADLLDWIEPVKGIMDRYAIRSFILTGGSEGFLAFTPEGINHAASPKLQAVNAAGAGDAVSAAIVNRLQIGDSWEQALKWAAAASAAVVLTEATAECSLAGVLAMLPRAQVERLE